MIEGVTMKLQKIPNIIDVEASGIANESYPIEIGIAFDDGKRYCTLIRPAKNWKHWDSDAEKIHNITRETLMSYGKPIKQIVLELNELLKGKTLYSDGWVVDKPWMMLLFHHVHMDMSFSISPLEVILSEEQMSIWHTTKDQVIEDINVQRHRASNDARIIQETYKRTLDFTT